MRSIDCRFRPPFRSFLNGSIFNSDMPPTAPPSVKERSMEKCLQEMDENEVVAGMVNFRKGENNEDALALAELYPDRFHCFINIDPFDGESIYEEINKYKDCKGIAGICIEPGQFHYKRTMKPNAELLYPIYEKCVKDDILLYMTYGGGYLSYLDDYDPQYLFRMLNDFPTLRILIAHGGYPYTQQIFATALFRPNLYICPDSYILPHIPGHEDYVVAANYLLKDRILFGSCYPLSSLPEALEGYKVAGIHEDVLPAILYDNAARLLRLE